MLGVTQQIGPGPLALALTMAVSGIAPTAGASPARHKGPVYPAPGSGTETTTPTTDGAIGLTGGVTFSFSNVKVGHPAIPWLPG